MLVDNTHNNMWVIISLWNLAINFYHINTYIIHTTFTIVFRKQSWNFSINKHEGEKMEIHRSILLSRLLLLMVALLLIQKSQQFSTITTTTHTSSTVASRKLLQLQEIDGMIKTSMPSFFIDETCKNTHTLSLSLSVIYYDAH